MKMSQKSHSIIYFDEISINCYSLYAQDAIISMIYYIEDFFVKYDSIPVLQIFPESQTNGYKAHSKLKDWRMLIPQSHTLLNAQLLLYIQLLRPFKPLILF